MTSYSDKSISEDSADIPDVPVSHDQIARMLVEKSEMYLPSHHKEDSFEKMYGHKFVKKKFKGTNDNNNNGTLSSINNHASRTHTSTKQRQTALSGITREPAPLKSQDTGLSSYAGTIKNESLKFGKSTLIAESFHPSKLTSQLQRIDKEKGGGGGRDEGSGDIMDELQGAGHSEQIVDKQGRVIIKELPFNKNHFKSRVFVEINKDDDATEELILLTEKSKKVDAFIEFIKSEYKKGYVFCFFFFFFFFYFFFFLFSVESLIKHCKIQLFVADEDGDLDDDYPMLGPNQTLSQTGLSMFFLKIVVDSEQRKTIVADFRTMQARIRQHTLAMTKVASISEEMEERREEEEEKSAKTHANRSCANCLIL